MNDQRRPDPSSRPDPYELAVQRAAQEPEAEEEGGAPLPRLQVGPFRVGPLGLLLGFAGIVAVASLVRLQETGAPELPSSCAPALALSTSTVFPGGLVRWSATGPEGQRVALRVGSQAVPEVRLVDCSASGEFGAQVAPGSTRVQLVDADDPSTVLAEVPLEVEPPRG